MERRVEDRDVRNAVERAPRLADRGERRRVVQRRDRRELPDRGLDLVVDLDRCPEPLAAVDDAVADGVGVDPPIDDERLFAVDEVAASGWSSPR